MIFIKKFVRIERCDCWGWKKNIRKIHERLEKEKEVGGGRSRRVSEGICQNGRKGVKTAGCEVAAYVSRRGECVTVTIT